MTIIDESIASATITSDAFVPHANSPEAVAWLECDHDWATKIRTTLEAPEGWSRIWAEGFYHPDCHPSGEVNRRLGNWFSLQYDREDSSELDPSAEMEWRAELDIVPQI